MVELLNIGFLCICFQGFFLGFLIFFQKLDRKNISRALLVINITVILCLWNIFYWENYFPNSFKICCLQRPLSLFVGPLFYFSIADRFNRVVHIIIPLVITIFFLALYAWNYFSIEPWVNWSHFFRDYKIVDVLGYRVLIVFFLASSFPLIKKRTDKYLAILIVLMFTIDFSYQLPWLISGITFEVDYIAVGFGIFTFYKMGYAYFTANYEKYTNSSFSEKEILKHKKRLLSYLEDKKAYLDPDLRIDTLSTELGLHSKKLSEVINRGFNKTFLELLNYYRIENAKKLLEENGELTILEVIYSSGFNSKSAFYELFKKKTGLTPKRYMARFGQKNNLEE